MNQPLSVSDTQGRISSSLSEPDTFSDSDWLDIASNRESSDNESVSSNNGGVSSSLSRRSSFSTASSRDDEIEAWEGFIEDSTDEAEGARDHVLDLGPIDEERSNNPFVDFDKEHVEERRVRDGLDQSLISTLSASRTNSSHPSTVHNSLRDLRLSFPDPLNNSHDELNRSYDRVSSTEDITADNELDVTVARTGATPMRDPGLPPTPEVLGQDTPQTIQFESNISSANLQLVLYGPSTPSKVIFVNEFIRKVVAGGELDVNESDTERYRVVIIDRTGNASTPRSDYNPDRPSLAIVFLPFAHATIPLHTAYLPVFDPSNEESFEKEYTDAQEAWASYEVPARRVVRLEGSSSSSLFVAEDVDKLDPYHTHQAVQRTMKQERPASWIAFFEQFNTVHAVTLFALLCIIAGFSFNSVFNVPPLKGIVILPPSPTVAKSDNQSTALAVRTTSSISVVPAAINYVPAVYSRGTVSLSEAGPSTAPPPTPKSLNADPVTHLTWTERMKVSKDVIIRPSTSVSAQTSSILSEPSVEPVASTSATATQESSTSALSVRLVDSISEIVFASVKALVEVVEHDMKDIVLALDELMLAIHRSKKAVVEQYKSAAQVVREQFEYRNARAKDQARVLREKGKQIMSYAESAFWGRKAKQGVHLLKEKIASSDYVEGPRSLRKKLRKRMERAQRRAHRQKEGIKTRRITMEF
ncbi:hypothetical protein GYMLUDRAFT_57803 [Collybiopsis luxurians FD-317 M1]|uniref:Uncharacterized protein n=1 Tax=Collybiopsis luxurians FD-317 M1 TaxID=944289 RepID=A0A0D0CU85_9AGAR|nr:hypothetical protein GYMLUDRAFT_57803 [Collybiopsis luxurians FD-317 M1]